MATYDYRCQSGHVHERRNIAPDDYTPRPCPECMKPAERQWPETGRPIVKDGTPVHHGRAA